MQTVASMSLVDFQQQMYSVLNDVQSGVKKIITDNGTPFCVIMPIKEYALIEQLADEIFDAKIERLAYERLQDPNYKDKLIPAETLYQELGITDKDLEGWEDVEIG